MVEYNDNIVRLAPPPDVLDNIDMEVQERIYGHRFVQEQEPYMIVLETLAACASVRLGECRATKEAHESFSYELPHRRKMRFLLFKDSHLEKIVNEDTVADNEKWPEWKKRINEQYSPREDSHDSFKYLDEVFSTDIGALYQCVRILKSRELDVMHNRRWTSRFLAVTGPDMICADIKEGSWSPDRRFFGRGGEIVYLMLNRSRKSGEAAELIEDRLLGKDDPMNKMACKISDNADNRKSSVKIGFLPYYHLNIYDSLADDWISILKCEEFPNANLFEPLFRITGINLMAYFVEINSKKMNMNSKNPIVFDLTNGANKQMREEGKKYLNMLRDDANRTVRKFIRDRLKIDDQWNQALQYNEFEKARKRIKNRFLFNKMEKLDYVKTPAELEDGMAKLAIDRAKNNIYKYLMPFARNSGFATARLGIGTWLAIDDSSLFALVLANVDKPMELREFLEILYNRYGIVIGPQEACKAFGRIQVERYKNNLTALESRLADLALSERLSDDCAFVINPYR